jgi:hypothetical protein
VTKKPNPQQRAIEKKRAQWREWRAKGYRVRHDPDTYNFESERQHFDRLSDEEWAPVWEALQSASPKKSLEETRLRELIDFAAISSGWFVECDGELIWYPADYRRFAREKRDFSKKAKTFQRELSDFLADHAPDGAFLHARPSRVLHAHAVDSSGLESKPPDNDYVFWLEYRELIPVLDQLATELERDIAEDEGKASTLKNPSNPAEPKLDAWRARLLLIWSEEIDLPIANTKLVRGFLIAALQPYMPNAATDRMAKAFISKWLHGKVPKPPPLL